MGMEAAGGLRSSLQELGIVVTSRSLVGEHVVE
jgi:hypothetical protein